MTTDVDIPKKWDAIRDSVKFNLSLIVILCCLGVIIFGFVKFFNFLGVSSDDMNPITWEHWVYWGFLLGGIAYLIPMFLVVQYSWRNDFYKAIASSWEGFSSKFFLDSTATWFMVWALFPLAAIWIVDSRPHLVYTPSGYVRILDTGKLVTAGDSAISNRYEVTSTLVPLQQSYAFTTTVDSPTGDVTLAGTVQYTIDPFASGFADDAARYRSDLRTDPNRLSLELVKQIYNPVASDLVRGVQSGMLSGSRSALLVHSGLLLHLQGVAIPWAKNLSFSDISVESWEQTFE